MQIRSGQVRFGRAILGCAITLALTGPFVARAQTRIGQPIYPAYQGFVDNPDGSITMVFQYFSHGRDPVTVTVGPDNSFTGVADRNQPITFQPGNHEFVCVIIVDNRQAAEQLRWTVAFPEAASSTSTDPLNEVYQLTKRSQTQANRDLDLTTAPRDVCINKPPRVNIVTGLRRFGSQRDDDEIAELSAKVGEELELRGFVQDEGLPRDSRVTVTWRQASGPGTVVFAPPNQEETAAAFSAAGSYELELHASDGALEGTSRIKVTVAPADAGSSATEQDG